MNYLVAVDSFFPDAPGGSGRVAWELACAMRKAGHTVAMVCGSSEHLAVPTQTVDDVIVSRYRYPRLAGLDPRRLSAHVEAAAEACRRFTNTHWDVVHGHTLASATGVLKAARPRAAVITIHSPVVLEQEVNWRNGTFLGWFKRQVGLNVLARGERTLLRRANVLTALSKYTVHEITALHGSDIAGRIHVLPGWSCVTPATAGREAARVALGWPLDARIVFSLRRLVPRMGLDTLIDGVRLLRGRHRVAAFIGGEGPERTKLERRIGEAGLTGVVQLVGRLSDEQVNLAYRAADVFVVPSRALECFGLIVVEALASGCPTVASRVGALPEVLEPLGREFLFEPDDAKSLAEAVDSVLLNPPSEATCQAYVASRFDRRTVIDQYTAIITEAAA